MNLDLELGIRDTISCCCITDIIDTSSFSITIHLIRCLITTVDSWTSTSIGIPGQCITITGKSCRITQCRLTISTSIWRAFPLASITAAIIRASRVFFIGTTVRPYSLFLQYSFTNTATSIGLSTATRHNRT